MGISAQAEVSAKRAEGVGGGKRGWNLVAITSRVSFRDPSLKLRGKVRSEQNQNSVKNFQLNFWVGRSLPDN